MGETRHPPDGAQGSENDLGLYLLCCLSQGRVRGFAVDHASPKPGGVHSRCDDRANLFSRFDEMPVGKVGIAGGGPIPPMPEELADQRQGLHE